MCYICYRTSKNITVQNQHSQNSRIYILAEQEGNPFQGYLYATPLGGIKKVIPSRDTSMARKPGREKGKWLDILLIGREGFL